MGVYDTYGEQTGQLKVGDVSLCHYDVGDTVSIPDGVYLTYVNVIVILNGVFIAEFETLTSKWGEPIKTILEQAQRDWWSDYDYDLEQVMEELAEGDGTVGG